MTRIDKRAIVSAKAEIAEDVEIGPFTIVEDNVIIGKGTKIGANCYIASGTVIGEYNVIYHHVVLGTDPQHLGYRGEPTLLKIGNRNVIREFVSIHRAYSEDSPTTIGDDCYVMATSHIGHDCKIGNSVIITSFCGISGHVEIEDKAVIGGHVGIHQFVRIGMLSIVSGASGVAQDVPPFVIAAGRPAKVYGLNVVGLKRAGYDESKRLLIKRVFDTFYRKNYTFTEALKVIEREFDFPEAKIFVEFVRKSKRGVCGFAREKKS